MLGIMKIIIRLYSNDSKEGVFLLKATVLPEEIH